MLTFERNNRTINTKVTVNVPGHGDVTYTCPFIADDEFYAGFLREAFTESFRNGLERIRSEAYESGWKDAKGRKKKQTWFSRFWK